MERIKWTIAAMLTAASLSMLAQSGSQQPEAQAQGVDTTNVAGTSATGPGSSGQSGSERASNTPAVMQTTTSSSGSPAVLSGENGRDRDGTNSVQRASLNMAGSPPANLNLDTNGSGGADGELKQRQGYTKSKELSEQRQSTTSPGGDKSGKTPASADREPPRKRSKSKRRG